MRSLPLKALTIVLCLGTTLPGLPGCAFRFQKLEPGQAATEDASLSGALVGIPSYDTVNRLVLQPKCLSCHGAKQEPILLTYEQVKANLDDIAHEVLDEKSMPPAGPLSGPRPDLLKKWIDAGAPLNGEEAPSSGSGSGSTTPGILRPVTYAQVKEKVFEAGCTSCHFPSNKEGNSDLTTYDAVMSEAGSVFGMTVLEPSMPPADTPGVVPLTQEQKDLISLWFSDGLKP